MRITSATGASLRGLNVVVTGGAGFIGNEVCRQLVSAGANVTAIDNLVNGKMDNLADLRGSAFSFHQADIRDVDRMSELLRSRDLVLHLACLGVRHSIHAPIENHDVNATATLRLLELARGNEVGRFVYVSSSEVYGTAQTAPMSEQHPLWPMTVYGAAKLAGERYTDAYWRTYRYPTTVVRPFNAFGPRSHHECDSGEVIPKFLLRALCGSPLLVHGDGRQTRDFTFVADTAAGIIACATSPHTLGETINLGSGREISINDLANAVAAVVGSGDLSIEHGPDRPGDVRRLLADVSKARTLVGFQAQVGIEEGMRRLLNWYRSLDVPLTTLLAQERPVNWVGSR
ncbi:MAG: SDR family NAD(P)-dependent oxidoreductase [Gammaproteobacteria bacterium]|nr:SDR family NAD(P)-dependent oxidoreductase [Gammaproteobacteria bacterium]